MTDRTLPRLLWQQWSLSGGIPCIPWGWAWCALPAYPDSTTRTGVRARYAGARFGSGRGDYPSVTHPRASIAPATVPAGACGPCAGCGFLSGEVMTSPAGHEGPEARRAPAEGRSGRVFCTQEVRA